VRLSKKTTKRKQKKGRRRRERKPIEGEDLRRFRKKGAFLKE
jgi:hypothetical protein